MSWSRSKTSAADGLSKGLILMSDSKRSRNVSGKSRLVCRAVCRSNLQLRSLSAAERYRGIHVPSVSFDLLREFVNILNIVIRQAEEHEQV